MAKTAQFYRGFKEEAKAYAREFREELGLKHRDPLPPNQLAKLLEIPVIPLSKYEAIAPEAIAHFSGPGSEKFSAMVVPDGTYKWIVYNDFHHRHRQASNIAHELAHIILGHPPAPPLDSDGKRNSDPQNEREAHWLGFSLLISHEAAISIVKRGISEEQASRPSGHIRAKRAMKLNHFEA